MRDESGGIEGMPLQLMIAVIVAGLTLAVVLGWILSVQTPAVIRGVSTNPTSVELGNVPIEAPAAKTVATLTVSAFDGKNAPLAGVIVTLGGAVRTPYVAQDEEDGAGDGTATFRGVVVGLPPGVGVGEITVTVQKAGYPTKSWSIPVVRGA